ncbi:hypothetical protein Tco_1526495 [Tanacetum coccineum]
MYTSYLYLISIITSFHYTTIKKQPQSSDAQQITLADQLVHSSKFQTVRRCKNYAVLPNIPCLKKCRIVRQLLVDHAISYALTATADVPAVYIQQFWKTVRQVPNHNETNQFMVNNEEITYIVNMFRTTLKLPVETPEQPFIPPADFNYIKPFLRILGYQGSLKKVSAFFTKNLAQPWQTMFKVFNRCLTSRTSGHDQTKINVLVEEDCYPVSSLHQNHHVDIMEKYELIPKRLEEEYHSIKDDIPLVSVYSTREVIVRGMLITNDLLTDAIKDTQAYKDYVEKYRGVEVLLIQPEPVESA